MAPRKTKLPAMLEQLGRPRRCPCDRGRRRHRRRPRPHTAASHVERPRLPWKSNPGENTVSAWAKKTVVVVVAVVGREVHNDYAEHNERVEDEEERVELQGDEAADDFQRTPFWKNRRLRRRRRRRR